MRTWTKEERYRYLKDPQELLALYQAISASPYRQTFHNQAVTGLMNDPNGFVWHDNKWHLFYQWCPWGAVHGLKHWYHIVSKDLVTWKNLGVCLLPDQEDGYDNKGVYSETPTGPAMPIPAWPGWEMTAGRKSTPFPCSAPIRTTPSTREIPRSSKSPAEIPTTC